MATARLDGSRITDWTAFHAECKAVFGFPDTYNDTMDAWVDCLSYLRDEDGMSRFRLAESEVLTIELLGAADLRKRLPEIVGDLEMCIDGINERYEDYGEKPALRLVAK
jgi:hypothetical protein